ncbi:MAG: energy-coupling factor transporter transmembrane component T [Gordonibacter pamelaeae]
MPGTSLLHRMNPVAKLAAAALFAVACFCSSNLVFLAVLLAVGFALAATCGMMRPAIGLAKAVFAFSLILAVVQILTTPSGAVLAELPWGYIGTGSLLAALTTVVRLMAAAIPLFLVFYVTKMNDITNAVVKVLHVPYKYAFTFTSTIHFIPLFMNDMKGIMEAQTARGVEFDAGGIVRKVRLMVPLRVPLLVSSVRKTNSAAIAAEVRGFNLRGVASGYKEYPFAALDAAALAACVLLLAASVALGLLVAVDVFLSADEPFLSHLLEDT